MMTTGSTAAQASASGARSGFVRSMVVRVRRLAASWSAPWRRRAAINALHELDDRTLRDIGLARDQIETAIAELERIRRTRQSRSHWF